MYNILWEHCVLVFVVAMLHKNYNSRCSGSNRYIAVVAVGSSGCSGSSGCGGSNM